MTDRDKLKTMTDEELANIIELHDCFGDGYICPEFNSKCECTCKEGFLKWLKQEVNTDE